MTPGEVFCLREATRCFELAEHFKSLGRIDDMSFWIRVYHQFLRDAHMYKSGVHHADQVGFKHSSHRDVGHRHADHVGPASVEHDRIDNGSKAARSNRLVSRCE